MLTIYIYNHDRESCMSEQMTETEDVRTLLGSPKKALMAMAVPMMIAMVVQSANNLIDAVWLAGLGTAALAATGVVFPVFFIVMGLGNGIGIGASQSISRRIGANDRESTSRVASQAVMIGLTVGIAMTAIFLAFAEPLMAICGAGDYLSECTDYAMPIILFIPVIMIGSILSGLLRAEGASKRAMNIQVAGAVTNLVLDPVFIYILDWGIAGAAWATSVSMTVSMLIALYWYLVKKDTFVGIHLRGFRFEPELDRDIMKVGIPASMEYIFMSLVSIVMNAIILTVDPVDGIAVYSSGWRALEIIMIPAMSFGFSIVPICAAAYGARRMDKFRDTYMLAVKYGVCVMLFMSAFLLAAAPDVSMLFSYSDGTADLRDQISAFLRISALFIPFSAMSFASASMFQSLGMGTKSLVATVLMNLLGVPVCAALSVLGDLSLLWYGTAVSEIAGGIILMTWARMTISQVEGTVTAPPEGDRI